MFGVVDIEQDVRISIRKLLDDELGDGVDVLFAVIAEPYRDMPVFHERLAVVSFIGLDALPDGLLKCRSFLLVR